MKHSYHSSAKVKLSAAVYPATLTALDRLRRERRLRSRSEAVAEALAAWAGEYQRESRVAEAEARYGARYAKAARWEEAQAARFLGVSLRHRRTP